MNYSLKLRSILPYGLLILALFPSACNVTKQLDDAKGERLLVKNSLEITAPQKMGFAQRTALAYELSGLYKLKPNEKNLFVFRHRVWFYYKYKDRKGKFAQWIMRRIAEAPTIYDEEQTQKTAANFKNYMRQRGYFKADCRFETAFVGNKKAKTAYTLDLGPLFTIRETAFASPDSNIQRILNQEAENSQLKKGGAMDGRMFEAEKLRITAALKNRGYAYFIPNYVEFIGDSTGTATDVTVEVLTETDSTLHKIYRFGEVSVFSSLVPDYSSIRRDTTLQDIYFASAEPEFKVKPSRLRDEIMVHPDSLYRQEAIDQTIRNLNNLGIFRFVSVKPYPDSLQPEQLNVAVAFSTYNRLSIGGGVDLNSSNSAVSGRLLGIASSLNARNRNVFRGAELVQTNLQYNLEFDITNRNRPIFSQEFAFQNDLTFPRFFDYLGWWKGLSKIQVGKHRLLGNSFYNNLRANGQTRLSLSYNYLELINYYAYNLFHATFGYEVRPDQERYFSFDNIGIDALRPVFGTQFDSLFGRNEFLKNSFDRQLFTGFLMRSMTHTINSKPNAFGERWYMRFNAELSGLEIFMLNQLWSAAFKDQTWRIADVDFSKYLRLEIDGSYTREFSRSLTAALRLGAGVVGAYGDTREVPYVKQFFVGGPSSIRAWRIRELGPGKFRDPNPPAGPPYYQAANFRLDFNAELRFPLFWWFKGALFVDGGNIWTFQPDPDRPGGELRWDSYKDIALGTGFGIRGDFDFFVLRFDLGLKMRQPYPDDTGRYWVLRNWSDLSLRAFNPNLSVGYPF
jgi:outer membrane protein insertion porin family